MDVKKNKTLVTAVVLFVAFGLVIAYVPLFFAPPTNPVPALQEQEESLVEPPATASLTPPIAKPEVTATTSTSTEEKTPLPDSFSGLEEESESLEGLLEGF